MKRIIAILLALAVIASFASCKGKPESSNVLTEVVTDTDGEAVTDSKGEYVTEIVTDSDNGHTRFF